MSIISNILNATKVGFTYRKVAWYILLIQIFLSSLIAILAYNYLQGSIGHSTNYMKIIDGYNHDVLQDLLRYESTGWTMIKTFAASITLFYFLLGPFITAGLMNAWSKNDDSWRSFFDGGSKHYAAFLKLNLLASLILIIFLAILTGIGLWFTNYGLANLLTELPMLYMIAFLTFLFILILCIVVSINANAKWQIIQNGRSPWSSFKFNLKATRSKWLKFMAIGLLFLVLSILIGIAANFIINCIPESGLLLVLLAFVIQLLVLYIRVCIRNAYIHSVIFSDLLAEKPTK